MTEPFFERALTTKDFRIVAPVEESSELEFLSIPKARIPKLVEEYIALMETEVSEKWCKCEWQIHPDDVDVKESECRKCGGPKEIEIHNMEHGGTLEEYHKFAGRRKRRKDEHPQCPVHTRAGLILGFYEWVFAPTQELKISND